MVAPAWPGLFHESTQCESGTLPSKLAALSIADNQLLTAFPGFGPSVKVSGVAADQAGAHSRCWRHSCAAGRRGLVTHADSPCTHKNVDCILIWGIDHFHLGNKNSGIHVMFEFSKSRLSTGKTHHFYQVEMLFTDGGDP